MRVARAVCTVARDCALSRAEVVVAFKAPLRLAAAPRSPLPIAMRV